MSFTTTAMTTDIQSLILDELRAIRGDIKDIKTDVSQLKTDVSQLKAAQEQTDLKIVGINKDINAMKGDIRELKTDVRALKTAQEQTDLKIVGINNDINTMKGDIADMKTKFDTRMTGFETELGTMNNKLIEGRYIRRSFFMEGCTLQNLYNAAVGTIAAIGAYSALFSEKQKCE